MNIWHLGLAAVAVAFLATHAQARSYCPPTPCSNQLKQNKNGEYVIKDVCDLEGIPANATGTYVLTQNIDANCTKDWNSGHGFAPISGAFNGWLKGNGHWINGLRVQWPLTHVGLFDTIGNGGGTAERIALTNVTINDYDGIPHDVGALAGVNLGYVTFAYVTGCVSSSANCVSIANNNFIGGLVGENENRIDGSYFNGEVVGRESIGGLVGGNGIGGIGGATIQNSGSSGNVVADGSGAGGLIGVEEGGVDSTYSTAAVKSANGTYAGGLVGELYYSASNSFSTGTVTSSSEVGGFIGGIGDPDHKQTGSLFDNYSIGRVVAAGSDIGGFAGYSNDNGTNANNYWDTEVSGQSFSALGTPETTKQLKAALLPGFDSSRWTLIPSVTYPFQILFNCLWGGSSAANCTQAMANPNRRDPACADTDKYFCSTVPPIMSLFEPPLSQFVLSDKQVSTHAGVYTIIPAGQTQLFEYSSVDMAETQVAYTNGLNYPAAALACAATSYTMLARLVGAIYSDAQVMPNKANICQIPSEPASNAHIDCLLGKDGAGFWPNSLNAYAQLKYGGSLNDADVELKLIRGQPVVLHGMTKSGANGATIFDHFVLATSVIKSGDSVTRLVIIDPEIGMQVFVDVDANDSDVGAYHHAVFNPTGKGDVATFKKLAGYDLEIDQVPGGGPGTYTYLAWQNHT